MTRESPFHLATAALRARLRSGRIVQGEQLMAAEICRDLGLSQTPVREALAFLAGQGLIEERRGFGYFAWRLDAVDLGELYGLQAALVTSALKTLTGRQAGAAPDPAPVDGAEEARGAQDGSEACERLFAALVRLGRSRVLLEVNARLADRLAPARRMEKAVLGDAAGEVIALLALGGDGEAMEGWSQAYHARRIAQAPAIVSAMRSDASEAL